MKWLETQMAASHEKCESRIKIWETEVMLRKTRLDRSEEQRPARV